MGAVRVWSAGEWRVQAPLLFTWMECTVAEPFAVVDSMRLNDPGCSPLLCATGSAITAGVATAPKRTGKCVFLHDSLTVS